MKIQGALLRVYITRLLNILTGTRTLTMLDLMEVNTYKMMDCNVAHHDKEIVQ